MNQDRLRKKHNIPKEETTSMSIRVAPEPGKNEGGAEESVEAPLNNGPVNIAPEADNKVEETPAVTKGDILLDPEIVNANPEASTETLMAYLEFDEHDEEDRKPEGQLAMFWQFC